MSAGLRTHRIDIEWSEIEVAITDIPLTEQVQVLLEKFKAAVPGEEPVERLQALIYSK